LDPHLESLDPFYVVETAAAFASVDGPGLRSRRNPLAGRPLVVGHDTLQARGRTRVVEVDSYRLGSEDLSVQVEVERARRHGGALGDGRGPEPRLRVLARGSAGECPAGAPPGPEAFGEEP